MSHSKLMELVSIIAKTMMERVRWKTNSAHTRTNDFIKKFLHCENFVIVKLLFRKYPRNENRSLSRRTKNVFCLNVIGVTLTIGLHDLIILLTK